MKKLTINAIRNHPFNALKRKIPNPPARLLLELAFMTAVYYRDSQRLLMDAATDDRLRFYYKDPDEVRQIYDNCCLLHDVACWKMDEISNLFENEFDEWICDIER